MQLVLYAPGLGYYVAGARKFGADGDFVTAPELTPLFGATLARQVAAILDATDVREIVELGAGSGRSPPICCARSRRRRFAPALPNRRGQSGARRNDSAPHRSGSRRSTSIGSSGCRRCPIASKASS